MLKLGLLYGVFNSYIGHTATHSNGIPIMLDTLGAKKNRPQGNIPDDFGKYSAFLSLFSTSKGIATLIQVGNKRSPQRMHLQRVLVLCLNVVLALE